MIKKEHPCVFSATYLWRSQIVLFWYTAIYECVHWDHGKPVALRLMRATCLKCRNCSLCDEDILTQWSPIDSNLNVKQPMNATYAEVWDEIYFPHFHSPKMKLPQFEHFFYVQQTHQWVLFPLILSWVLRAIKVFHLAMLWIALITKWWQSI